MNYQDLKFDFIDRRRPQPPQFWSPDTPPHQADARSRPNNYDNLSHGDELIDDSLRQPSISPQPTAFPFAPSPPSLPWESSSSPSILGQYGDTRIFGYPFIDNRLVLPSPTAPVLPMSGFDPTRRLQESRMAVDELTTRAVARGFRDDLAIDAGGSVTPGMDDGPFLNYALDALTAEKWRGNASISDSIPIRSGLTANGVPYDLPDDYYDFDDQNDPYPRRHITAGHELPALQPIASMPPARTRDSVRQAPQRHSEGEILKPTPWGNLAAFNTTPPLTPVDPQRRAQALGQAGDETKIYPINDTAPYTKDGKTRLDDIDPTRERYPRINYLPRILRPVSTTIFKILCALMAIIYIVAAIYSLQNPGLASFDSEDVPITDYLAFRVLPQLLAAIIYVYAQCITNTMIRIMPFASMANDDPAARPNALFRDIHPASFLIPHLVGPPVIKICQVLVWLGAFAIPFASHTFSVILVGESMMWTSVQPMTWILVVYYLALLRAAKSMNTYWDEPHTGLLWDPRSMADIAVMLYKSNTLDDYNGTELIQDREQFQSRLHRRVMDRLGYWRTGAPDQEPWYGIGLAAEYDSQGLQHADEFDGEQMHLRESLNSLKMSIFTDADSARYRYLPWILRSLTVAVYVLGAAALLGVLLGISFMRGAAWLQGFELGHLGVYPGLGAFSPANFVYSYFPSLLATLLYLSIQSLDMTLRIMEPWAELNKAEGSLPQRSILADYAACHPFQATWHALKNLHFRVAFVSLVAILSIFIPIIAGGLFLAVDLPGATNSIMYPNDFLFYILLGLVILYFIAVTTVVVKRSQYRLPHGVTTLAEIISFLNTEDIKREKAFKFPHARTRAEMLAQLDVSGRQGDNLWYFGSAPGREERLGVRKVKRFTDRSKA